MPPADLSHFPTLVALARHRAQSQGESRAYTFLLDGEQDEAHLSYAELDLQARAIGGRLQALGARNQPVLLLFAPGLEYVAAFVGCLYAGAIAVPAYPPDPSRLARTLPRLEALISDARARFALSSSFIRAMAESMGEQAPRLSSLTWINTDEVGLEAASSWQEPTLETGSPAFIQYTSGSTGAPRGVILSHANLLHNSSAIHHCFGHSTRSKGVIWLPPYHDMGLIGGVLQPLCGGFPVVLMSPLDFLRRPLRWLEAVSRHRATTSGGPNFAYDLCVRKTTPEQRAALDLSSWEVAFNGAEPVRAETLERFAQAFAPSGFRREAFYACYGLAEGTLIASGGLKSEPPRVQPFQARGLESGVALEDSSSQARHMVGCGSAIPGQQLLIVEPESRQPLPAGRLGEIWLKGPSVAQGYWERPEESEYTFRARRADTGEAGYLRTGDLGFLQGEELFVAGRIKDLIILRGRNHYPQDLEQAAEQCHPALRPGCSAAFSVELGGEERLVLVHEVDPSRAPEPGAVVDALRAAVAEQHEVQAYEVVLLGPGAIPKTSSGKVQRRACRALYLAGELEVLSRSALAGAAPEEALAALSREALLALAEVERPRVLGTHLRRRLARLLSVPESELAAGRQLVSLGLDSIQSVELKAALEEELGVELPPSFLLEGADVERLSERILSELQHPTASAPALKPVPREGHLPLSYAQERLLFLEELSPGSSAYNIPAAVELRGPLNEEALGRSLEAILQRHESLRACFPRVEGRRVQRLAPQGPGLLEREGARVDLSALGEQEQRAAVERLTDEEARQPFDLSRGPLLRVRLLRLGAEHHRLLLTVHHIVADGWSMGVLVRELGTLYGAFVQGRPSPLPELRIQYADFAAWQRRWLEAGLIDSELAWWKERLAGAPPLLELPTDRPRPAAQSFEGTRQPLHFSAELTASLKALARKEGATPYMVLLAAFLTVLHERTGRTDLVVGTDVANRSAPHVQQLLGLFVNQLVLRVDLAANPSFRTLLGRVRQVALEAYAHEHLPFGKLVEGLRPKRDPSYNPLFQVMFVLENAPLPELTLPGLSLRLLEVDDGGSPFDLSVLLSESQGRLGGVLRYATALYDSSTMARLANAYSVVLDAAVARPEDTLEQLRATVAEADSQWRAAQEEALRKARLEKFKGLRRKAGEQ